LRRKFRRRFLRWIAGFALTAGWNLIHLLSWKQASLLGTWLGRAIYLFPTRMKHITLSNLKLVLGDSLPEADRRKIAAAVFRNISRYMMQALKLRDLSGPEIDALVDGGTAQSALESSMAAGKSAIILTGHYSNWELLAAKIARIAPLTVLARINDNPAIQKWIDEARSSHSIVVIDRDSPSAARSLKQISMSGGQIVGLLMDQDTRVKSVFVPFLGHLANTPSGPAAFALKHWFDTYVGFIEEQPDGRYALKLSEKLEFEPSGTPDEDVLRVTTAINERIGEQILRVPEQWVWFHRRWRRKAD